VYNTALAALTYRQTAGSTVAGDDLHFAAVTTVRKGYAAGVYTGAVSVGYDTANTDYDVKVIPADYTVTPASLSAAGTDYSGVYDGRPHSASLSVKTGRFLTAATVY